MIRHKQSFLKEFSFQIVLNFLVLVFYAFDKRHPIITEQEVVFFLNYALAALFINYVLLPRFFYKKKYIAFVAFLVAILAVVIVVEEFVLEPIYFAGKRAENFAGIFFTLVDVLPVITILSGFKFAWDAFFKEREVEALKAVVQESELQFLKSQINPHFLFNNLNNLYAYAIENSPKTPDIILELSGVLRYMLYECKEKYVPLSKEMEQVENFVKLSEMQVEERGTVSLSIQEMPLGYKIAPLILSVFIENAFKHSTASQSDEILIDISATLSEQGILTFVCKNSFQNQSNTESLSYGIGLENVRKRLDILYPSAHELRIEKEADLYSVYLHMNLTKN